MVLLRTPSAEIVSKSVDQIIDSLDRSGLDKKTLLLLGGGALAFAGIRPAHDADVMIPHAEFVPLAVQLRTPNDTPLQHQQGTVQAFLRTTREHLPINMLPLDITHPHDADNRPSPELDEEFIRRLQDFDQIDGYHFLPPDLVAAHKRTVGRRKDRHDIKLIGQAKGKQNE